jgi:hypothetical protein
MGRGILSMMTLEPTEVVLTYEDGSTWFVAFNCMKDAEYWINEEKTRPYWKETTKITITQKPNKQE